MEFIYVPEVIDVSLCCIEQFEEDKTPVREYEVEDILEMLGGDQYYSMDKIMYVYHTLKGEFEEAGTVLY